MKAGAEWLPFVLAPEVAKEAVKALKIAVFCRSISFQAEYKCRKSVRVTPSNLLF